MKSMKNINAINFNALAKLAKDNKAAIVILLSALEVSRDGQVTLTNKAIIEATGIDKKYVSLALKYLIEKKFLIKDAVAKSIYHINSYVLRTHCPRSYCDADFFPEFSAKVEILKSDLRCSREQTRHIKRMNKLSDEDIANSLLSNNAISSDVNLDEIPSCP